MRKKYLDPILLKKISKDLYYEVSHLIELFLFLKQKEGNNVKTHALLDSQKNYVRLHFGRKCFSSD